MTEAIVWEAMSLQDLSSRLGRLEASGEAHDTHTHTDQVSVEKVGDVFLIL